MNDRIHAPVVLVIDEQGTRLGNYANLDAQRLARDRGLDLVEIVPNRVPPVCRIMNYGKYVYQRSKRSQDARRHQKQNQVKEVKFRIIIDKHDYDTKMRQIHRFLRDGHMVKATIWFKRARERSHREIGDQILDRVTAALAGIATAEHRSSMMGNQMSMTLAPTRRYLEAARAERAAAAEANAAAARGRKGHRGRSEAPETQASGPEVPGPEVPGPEVPDPEVPGPEGTGPEDNGTADAAAEPVATNPPAPAAKDKKTA